MDYYETYWLQQSQRISHLQNSPRHFVLRVVVLIMSQHHSLLQNASIFQPAQPAPKRKYYRLYMAILRKMATTCKFKDFLDEALRDRFVSRIRATSIQKRLLTEEDLSSAGALQLAQSMESAQNSSTGKAAGR